MKRPKHLWKWIVLGLAILLALSRAMGVFVKTAMLLPNVDTEASRVFVQDRIIVDWIVLAFATATAALMVYLIWSRRT